MLTRWIIRGNVTHSFLRHVHRLHYSLSAHMIFDPHRSLLSGCTATVSAIHCIGRRSLHCTLALARLPGAVDLCSPLAGLLRAGRVDAPGIGMDVQGTSVGVHLCSTVWDTARQLCPLRPRLFHGCVDVHVSCNGRPG